MLGRRKLLAGTTLVAAAAALARGRSAMAADTPVLVGISGPLTGPNAQYGVQWKASFDLAIEQTKAAGGPAIEYDFEDSQSDPRQSVAIAQKFVNDDRIIMEIGDFSSTASMAASPIYQRGKLVQFGMTNSHPDFTKGGDYMWSSSISQAEEQPNLAEYAVNAARPEEARRPAPEHRLGHDRQEPVRQGGAGQGRGGGRRPRPSCPARRISARRWCACATPTPPA